MFTLAVCLSLQTTEAMESSDTNEFGLSAHEIEQQARMLEQYKQRLVNSSQPVILVPRQRVVEYDAVVEPQRRPIAQFDHHRQFGVPAKYGMPSPMPFGEAYNRDEGVDLSEKFARQLQAEEEARFRALVQYNPNDEALARQMHEELEAQEKERIRLGEVAARALQAQFVAEKEREEEDIGAISEIVGQLYQRDLEEQEEARRRNRREAEDAASRELIERLETERLQALASAAQQYALPFDAVPRPVALGVEGFPEYDEALFNPPEVVKPKLALEADPRAPAREPVTGLLYNLVCDALAKMGPMPIVEMRNQLVAHAFDYMGVLTQITPGQAQYVIDKILGEDVD